MNNLTDREKKMLTEMNEASDILAEALGYTHDDEYGWATGDHTIVTLAMEVKRRGIKRPEEYDLKAHLTGWAWGNLQHHLIHDHGMSPAFVSYENGPWDSIHADAHAAEAVEVAEEAEK